ncbi:RluA family pseudouridine synthase [Veillonella sp. oral taxon 158]|jgi:pseudouridylate synthase|uniref:RluA family pseudouridine synthase n=1 Tax=Veillonella sp. oral taxon 158 TaxID=671228 RepID=UPI0001EB43EF|nr:RluA family pseudouridine synthase [Veillonella sp. oral taxon 158]EFR60192.1 pseudouridine synthase, RluA family [Veillonella sp. oral taxon 158 str. F0412]
MKTATIIDLIVDSDVHTQSMNHIIKQQHISQRMRRRLRNEGIITVNDEPATWNTLVHGGDHLVMKLTPEQEFSLSPMDLDIVYEDEHILVINKAAGVLMHPTSTVRDHTLANGVLYYYQETHQHYDFHPVHRLDKDTSGIVIIAKTSVVQHAFDKKHTHFYKTYDAIVEGKLPAVPLTINWPIGRKPGSIIERCCTNEGKPARTDITVISHNSINSSNTIVYGSPISDSNTIIGSNNMADENCETHFTHVQCLLHTGRTHQIRVHVSQLGYPLAGDDLYGGHLDYIQRQALHAARVSFHHPMTNEWLELSADMPQDMKDLIQ